MVEMLAQAVPALPPDVQEAFKLMLKNDIQSVLVASLMMSSVQIVSMAVFVLWLVRRGFSDTARQGQAAIEQAKEQAREFAKAMDQVNREREEAVLELRAAIESAVRPVVEGLAELRALVTGAMREFIDVLRAAHEATVRALREKKQDDSKE